MGEQRVRIADIAEELGLSTATVSNVIHGKTKKISAETVRRVQGLLEEKQYMPGIADVLLAQNNSRIIGVVVNDHEKYESHVLEDYFIASSLNHLSREIEKAGYFMMVKVTKNCGEIVRYASMWNMDGLVIIGFCEQDYKNLRDNMRIPFVVYDGYFKEPARVCNLIIDNYDGGYQIGTYFRKLGHQKTLCISDNHICVDWERYCGFRDAVSEQTERAEVTQNSCRNETATAYSSCRDETSIAYSSCRDEAAIAYRSGSADFLEIPMNKKERLTFYQKHLETLRGYTAIFAASDYYAIELMQFLQQNNVRIPQEISIAGFDDVPYCEMVCPTLTTVRQDGAERAKLAVSSLKRMREGKNEEMLLKLPVTLVIRQSTAKSTNFTPIFCDGLRD